MMAEVMGLSPDSLKRWIARQQAEKKPERKRGRPTVVSQRARWQLRQCFVEHHGQWGPAVLACWAQRKGIGRFSPSTIARVIEDLRPEKPATPKPRRYEIVTPGVMWSEDGAGFRERGRKRELVMAQDDCARLKVGHRLAEGPAKGTDVLSVLQDAFERYEPPLVLKRDGGSIFDEEHVMRFLDAHDVVVITSPSGCPAYNGKQERAVRDVRGYERALRKARPPLPLHERIEAAMEDLNEHRPRPVLGGRTAREVYEQEQRPLPSRKQFREEVERREKLLLGEAASRHQRDAARRRATEQVLLEYGLMKWTGDVSTNSSRQTGTN